MVMLTDGHTDSTVCARHMYSHMTHKQAYLHEELKRVKRYSSTPVMHCCFACTWE